jgi:hypothetical protein
MALWIDLSLQLDRSQIEFRKRSHLDEKHTVARANFEIAGKFKVVSSRRRKIRRDVFKAVFILFAISFQVFTFSSPLHPCSWHGPAPVGTNPLLV